MSKRLCSRISLACYLLFLIGGLTLAIILYFSGRAADDSNLGGAIGKVFSLVFAIIALAYAIASILPLTFKIISIKRGGGAAVICLIFDLMYCIANAALMISQFNSDGATAPGVLLFAALLLISLVSLAANLLSLRAE